MVWSKDKSGGKTHREKPQHYNPPITCTFWTNPNNYDLAEIISKEADGIADSIGNISRNQLRNFYGEVKRLQRELKSGEKKWEEALPLIKLIKVKASYAASKSSSSTRVPDNFVVFLSKSIEVIGKNDEKKFFHFCLIFEAIVGIMYGKEYAR